MSLIKKKSADKQVKKDSLIFGCLLTDSSVSGVNGLQQANNDFLRAIVRYSLFREVHIFTTPESLILLKAEWGEFVERYGNNKVIHFFPAYLLPDYFASTCYQVFHQGDPYIGHLASLRDSCAPRSFPITGRAHTLSTDNYLSHSRDLLLSPLKACDAILCSSQAQQQVMKRLLSAASASIADHIGAAIPYKGTLGLLPLGIESEIAFSEGQGRARELLGIDDDQFVILALGRITASDKMDLHPLLLAINDLIEVKGVRNVSLVIAGTADGSSELVQSLLKQAYNLNLESTVRFELSVDEERKQWLLSACDVFVSVSDNIQESFGLAPLEAMAYRKPVVLSDWNGYRELIEDGESGILIPTLSADMDTVTRRVGLLLNRHAHLLQAQAVAIDINGLVQAFEWLMSNPKKRESIANAGYKRLLDQFQWSHIIDGYHGVVDQLNQEARKLSPSLLRPVGLPYFQVFEHYPSEQLRVEHCFKTTNRGVRILTQSEGGFCYSQIKHLLEIDDVRTLAKDCLRGKTLSELKGLYPDNVALEFTLLWMCKYQLLEKMMHPKTAAQKAGIYWLPEAHDNACKMVALVNRADPHSYQLLEPVVGWFVGQVVHCIPAQWSSEVMTDLLNHLYEKLEGSLLQAIGWLTEELQASTYLEVIEELKQRGGLRYLADHYPHWYRCNRKLIIKMVKGYRLMFSRVQLDMKEVNQYFGDIWDAPVTCVERISFPPGKNVDSVIALHFDNKQSLIYKNRDVRIDCHLVGDTGDNNNIAGQLNQWLGDIPGLATHRIMPRCDQWQYGYCEMIHHSPKEALNAKQAEEYYKRMGVLVAVALMTGMGDLHHSNVITRGSMPCVVDAEAAFHASTLRVLEREMKDGVAAFARGVDESSFYKTGLWHLWQTFYSSVLGNAGVRLVNGELIEATPQKWFFVNNNVLKVGERNSLDGGHPSLAAEYSVSVVAGFRGAIVAISEHQVEWSALLSQCAEMTVRYLPLLDHGVIEKQSWDLKVFNGFQLFTQTRMNQYLQQMSMRVALGGEEIQRWIEPEWKEPTEKLAKGIMAGWCSGESVDFVTRPDRKMLGYRVAGSIRGIKDEDGYFPKNNLSKAIELSEWIANDHQCRDQLVVNISSMLLQWLEEVLAPGDNIPLELKSDLDFYR